MLEKDVRGSITETFVEVDGRCKVCRLGSKKRLLKCVERDILGASRFLQVAELIVFMDNTYKTNKYILSLLEIVGMTSI